MSLTKDEVIKKIERAYAPSHDIRLHEDKEQGLLMEADFHVHSEKYVLSKKAQLYQMNCCEYVYVFYYPNLTLELFDNAVNMSYEIGYEKIKPDINHRSTYIVAEFLCDTFEDDALKALKKYRRRKSFHFSLHGWMEMHMVLIDLLNESVASNSDGRLCGKFMKNVLHPRRRKGRFIF